MTVVTNLTPANRYEAGTGGQKYEAFKLSPFHGYLCSDSNVPDQPDYCQDMKVGPGAIMLAMMLYGIKVRCFGCTAD